MTEDRESTQRPPLARRVRPQFSHGGIVHGEPEYGVELSPCGLLIWITPDGEPSCAVSLFAWPGIVAAVGEILAEEQARARQRVVVDALLHGEP